MVLAFLLWAAVSCIRFEHIQRSKFDRCEASALFFTCSQGKARRQGARPAFQWAMPEIPWPGFSLVKIIQDFVTMELLPGGNYLWPALQLDPLHLWQVTCKLDRKLSRGRFLELLRGALLDLGTASDQAQTAGFNRLRHFGQCVPVVPAGPAGGGQLGGDPYWWWAHSQSEISGHMDHGNPFTAGNAPFTQLR